MQVGRWLTFIPLVFLLQVSFCGQQELDSAMLTVEARDDDGGGILSEARFLLDGVALDLAPPFDLELDPWVAHRIDVLPIEGWVFLPEFVNLTLEPGSVRTLSFEASSLTGILNVNTRDLWDGDLSGAEILVDGSPQGAQTPAALVLPAGRDLEITVTLVGFDFQPAQLSVNLETGGEESIDFEGLPNTRVVLVEDFSNINCDGCPEAEEAVWVAAGAASGELLPISFHLYWPYAYDPLYTYNIEINIERWFHYGGHSFYTLPNVFVDGSSVANPQDSESILERSEERLNLTRKVVLRARSQRDGGEVTVTVDGYVSGSLSEPDLRIFYGLAEANVHLENGGSNGQTHFQNIVRHVNGENGEYPPINEPDGQSELGEPFTHSQGESFSFSQVFTPDFEELDEAELFAFVFVQTEGSREILDAAQEPHGGP